MSEPDRLSEVEATTSANGTSAPEATGGETIAGRSDEKENGVEIAEEEAKNEKKDEDVKMEEAQDVKDEEKENKEGEGGTEEEEEVMKMEEEKEPMEDKEDENVEGKAEEIKEDKGVKKKRGKGRKVGEKGEAKEKKEGKRSKEAPSTPVPSSVDRPVRERKTVERLVEIIEKEPVKGFLIEKGHGTPLKDIPNVAYKLSKRKPDDIRLLHHILFGRKGKAVNFKNHISQFSGFVWQVNEEKQRAKVKEKLDKCTKDKLLDMCDVFDIPVTRTNARKEDLVVKLLDFMVAPHPTTDTILAEKDQNSMKSRKRKRMLKGSSSKKSAGTPAKRPRKKQLEGEDIPKPKKGVPETGDEEGGEENENGLPDEDDEPKHSESEKVEESEEDEDKEEEDDQDLGKGKLDTKKSSKRGGSARTEKLKKMTSPKKAPPSKSAKSPRKASLKRSSAEESNDANEKVFSRKKKYDATPKRKSSALNKPDSKEKTTGKKMGKGKAKPEDMEESSPSKVELRKTICEILKEVDFNTATFTDILKQLALHFNTDLTSRKAAIKLMIQEELTKLAEAEENEDDDEDEGDAEKDENPEPASKEVEA